MKSIVATFAALVIALFFLACAPTVFPPFPDVNIDGGDEVAVPPACRAACDNLTSLGCPESAPAGRSCGSVCAVHSRFSDLRLECVAGSKTPDQVRNCCPLGTLGCSPVKCAGR